MKTSQSPAAGSHKLIPMAMKGTCRIAFVVAMALLCSACSIPKDSNPAPDQNTDTILGGGSSFGNPLISLPLYFDKSGPEGLQVHFCIRDSSFTSYKPEAVTKVEANRTSLSPGAGSLDSSSPFVQDNNVLEPIPWLMGPKNRLYRIAEAFVETQSIYTGVLVSVRPGCIPGSPASILVDRGDGSVIASTRPFDLSFDFDQPQRLKRASSIVLKNPDLFDQLFQQDPSEWNFAQGQAQTIEQLPD